MEQIRRKAEPLDVFQSIDAKDGDKYDSNGASVGVSYCPLVQTYDVDNAKFIVDRGSVPTVIVPSVKLVPRDHVGDSYDLTSSSFANLKWYVQKANETSPTEITNHSEWTGLYDITSTGTERGVITLKKNIATGDVWNIWFECDFDDERTGYTNVIHIRTNAKTLSTTVNAESTYVMSISRTNGEIYDALLDKRLEYEYRAANGLLADGETFVDDGRTYLRQVDVQMHKGYSTLTVGTDYDIRIERYENGSYTVVTASDIDIRSISGNSIVFDLSWFDTAVWRITCYKGSRVLGYKDYGFARSTAVPIKKITHSATYDDDMKSLLLRAVLEYNGADILYPEAYCDISWVRKNTSGSIVDCGGGAEITLDLTNSDVVNSSSSAIFVDANVTVRGKKYKATDSDGKVLTDENGNILTIN